EPVAGAVLGVGAMNELLAGKYGRAEVTVLGLERDEHIGRVPVAERMAAVLAEGVLEIEDVAAMIAAEQFHKVAPVSCGQCARLHQVPDGQGSCPQTPRGWCSPR